MPDLPIPEPTNNIDDIALSHIVMRIVARLETAPYTDENKRQTAERELDDLADPASDTNTVQG
ncbi:MAG: hypothetical protein MUF38_18085 [Anaerolineae bacterium]|nr:hypothetical protein [Anaerolineae bacterium]